MQKIAEDKELEADLKITQRACQNVLSREISFILHKIDK